MYDRYWQEYLPREKVLGVSEAVGIRLVLRRSKRCLDGHKVFIIKRVYEILYVNTH
jgi:hypothetical protein